MKQCKGCGKDRPAEEFLSRRIRRPRNYCKRCHAERSIESRAKYGDGRHFKLVSKYGITALDVEEMIAEQGGVCAACKIRPAEQVDHDHKTGRVRGILCDGCNGAIALFNEDIALMERAVRYLNGEITY